MNKTLMLVICDFLLLSMLALARFDPPEEKPEAGLNATESSATAEAELIALLEESLESELNSRQNLTEDLTETRESLKEKARLLAEREAALKNSQAELEATSAKVEELAKTKAQIEAEQAALAAEKARIEAEHAQLAERFDSTRTELETSKSEQVSLVSTLGQLKEASSITKEKLSQTEQVLLEREKALAEREAALKAAEAEKARLAAEREALNRQLEVAQAERRLLEQNLTEEQIEKAQLQKEKEQAFARADRLTENVSELGAGVSQLGQGVNQLGAGVSTLTQASQEIKKEIEAARPQTMSEIYTRFQNNRASLRFTATEAGLFGAQNVRSYESKSILITDANGASYLVTHSANSPFAFNKNANNLLAASLEVTLGNRRFPVSQIGFLSMDPRILFVPLPQSIVDASGLETFQLALQPERWEEAVLIKNDESNFGRTGFRRLTESDRFLKMDRPALGQLFTDFASSRGDLAFTKNSQFIGILTDSEHAVVIDDFLAAAITRLGASFNNQTHADTMDRLRDRVQQLPEKIR
jgi:X-X-X-Leu-X-X-Gly heptad repeat protein